MTPGDIKPPEGDERKESGGILFTHWAVYQLQLDWASIAPFTHNMLSFHNLIQFSRICSKMSARQIIPIETFL